MQKVEYHILCPNVYIGEHKIKHAPDYFSPRNLRTYLGREAGKFAMGDGDGRGV